MATVEENMEIVRRVTELIEKEQNIDGLDEVFAKDFINHSPSAGFTPDIEGFKKTAAHVHEAFDLADSNVTLFGVDDMVVERWTESGTHIGTYDGVPATGRPVVTKGIAIWRLRDGKIVELWVQVNEADILRQIGLLPDAGHRATPT